MPSNNDNNGYSSPGYQYNAVEDVVHRAMRDKFNEHTTIDENSTVDSIREGLNSAVESLRESGIAISDAIKDRLDATFDALSKSYSDNFSQLANQVSQEFSRIASKDVTFIESMKNNMGDTLNPNDNNTLNALLDNDTNKLLHSQIGIQRAIIEQSKILTTLNTTMLKVNANPTVAEQQAEERRAFLTKLGNIIIANMLNNPTTKKLGQLGTGLLARWTLKNVAGNENLPMWMRKMGAASIYFQVPQSLMQIMGSVISFVLSTWLNKIMTDRIIHAVEGMFAKQAAAQAARGTITGLGSAGAGGLAGGAATGGAAAGGATAGGIGLGAILGVVAGTAAALLGHHYLTKAIDSKTLGPNGKQTAGNGLLHGLSGAIAGVLIAGLAAFLIPVLSPFLVPLLIIGGVIGAIVGVIKPIARWCKEKFGGAKDDNHGDLGTTPSVAGGGATYTGGVVNKWDKATADAHAKEDTTHIANIISDQSKVATSNSLPYIKSSNAANLKLIDTIIRESGYNPIYTSAMGGHDGNKKSGHYVGDKVDIQLMKDGKGVQPDAQLLAKLKAIGAWDENGAKTGALGWEAHSNQFTGGHLDLRTKGLTNNMYSNDEVLQLANRRAEYAEWKKKDKNNKATFEEYNAMQDAQNNTLNTLLNPASSKLGIGNSPSITHSGDATGMGNYTYNATNSLQQQGGR